jgi:hypothetical protein
MLPKKMKKTVPNDPNPTQEMILSKKIPKHRRPKYQIESRQEEYKKIDLQKDRSRRLCFAPFGYQHKTTYGEEIGHLRQTMKTSSKIVERFKLEMGGNRGLDNKMFAQLSQELKKTQGLKVFDFEISASSEIGDIALKKLGIGLKPLKCLQYLRIRMLECGYINDQGIANVGRAIRGLASLETLDLSFDEGGEVTDKGVRFFGAVLDI